MGLTAKILRNEKPKQYFSFIRNYLHGARITAPPILIVGCGHSGTSVLLRVLDMHPNIYGVPYESRVFLKSRLKIRLANLFWNKNTIAAGKHRWVEKTPNHIHAINRIFAIYPKAKILLIIRDGRDVAVSLRKRTGNFEEGVQRWIEDNRAGEAFWGHPQIFKLRYEDMVTNFEHVIPKVCEFIGEPYVSSMREFHQRQLKLFRSNQDTQAPTEAGCNHNQHRNWQINQRLFNGSGKWQEEITPEEKSFFKQQAGEMLIRYGYETSSDW